MNCKPGDLAVIIRGRTPGCRYVGTIVTVLELEREASIFGPIWVVEFSRPLTGVTLSKRGDVLGVSGLSAVQGCPDAWLRPIRDQPGADETLRWIDVPVPEIDEAPTA